VNTDNDYLGSSRTRSSVADNNSSNNFNNNTPQINNTRRARPPTPSRSNLSSASHTPPPSSSSPLSQPASISSSSGVNSGSAPNPPNANGAGGVLLSTQTQLASLRGALEAARLREEKHKAEMERVMKEVDVLRWEHANSRRGEIEVGFPFRSSFPFCFFWEGVYLYFFLILAQSLFECRHCVSNRLLVAVMGRFVLVALFAGCNSISPLSTFIDVSSHLFFAFSLSTFCDGIDEFETQKC